MIRHLGPRHVVAVDLRGHGRSAKPEITDWRVFGEDLAALLEALELEDVVGVGHSMGGHAMVDAAAIRPAVFRRLVLLDPVIQSPERYASDAWMMASLAEAPHPTSKRRNRFESPRAMFERFKDRRPYSFFDPAALLDYCEYGLLPAPDGEGFVLACPPAIEASIYMTSRTNRTIFESVRKVVVPVLVVRAMEPEGTRDAMDFSVSPTWPELAEHFAEGRDVQLADLTHFLPMQAPARIASLVLQPEKSAVGGRGAP
jgi:pimeloyl-ACP methyl ester carboxylesterase